MGALLACCGSAFALNPALDVSQYAHTAWRNRDGFARSEIDGITQTADGYLWLATEFGMLRFDGVRTAPWQPPPGQRLPSDRVRKLLAARDGALWIGTANGLASWKNGKLREYPEFAGFSIMSLVEDHVGAIWAGAYRTNDGKLCEIRDGNDGNAGNARCEPEIHGPGQGVTSLHEDSRGNLWVATFKGVWRWKPGEREYYPTPDEPNGIRGFADSPDRGILIVAPGAVRHLSGGKSTIVWPFPDAARASRGTRLLRDRDGGLWGGTVNAGIVHVHNGRTDLFDETDGLSSNFITQIFEDREGNIVAIRGEFPEARIIVLTTYTGDVQVLRAMQVGARAYLLKSLLDKELLETIRAVHAGKKSISPEASWELAEHATDELLTPAEVAVLRLIAAGNANKEIAAQLSVSEETVKGRVKNILSKLGANDRTHAAMIGIRRGIIEPWCLTVPLSLERVVLHTAFGAWPASGNHRRW